MKNNMYAETKTWNVFKGCNFNCIYCTDSFKRQAKRQKHNCMKCYNYEPHFHPERLDKIPKANLVFACGNGDISFADNEQKASILKAMQLKPTQTFLLQTKNPSCLKGYEIPLNVIIGTTIETNRNIEGISLAPKTVFRAEALEKLCCRKFVTIEPIMDFDLDVLKDWIFNIKPEIVWVGYANHTKRMHLDEPSLEKTNQLISELKKFTDVRLKTIRERES